MLKTLENKYYSFELLDYVKGCTKEELIQIIEMIKSNELNKTSIKVLGCIEFALDNYDLIKENSKQKVA